MTRHRMILGLVLTALLLFDKGLCDLPSPVDDVVLEAVRVDEIMAANGLEKYRANKFSFTFPTRSNADELSVLREAWRVDDFDGSGKPLEIHLMYGYFTTPSEIQRAWIGYRRISRYSGLPEEDRDGADLIIEDGATRQLLLKDQLLIEIDAQFPEDVILSDELDDFLAEIRTVVLNKIESQSFPSLVSFGADFDSSSLPKGINVEVAIEGGFQVGYSYILRSQNEVLESKTYVLTDQKNLSLTFDSLGPGEYLLEVTIADGFNRFRSYTKKFSVNRQGAAPLVFDSTNDTTLTQRHPHQNEGANPVLTLEKIQGKAARSAVAFDLADVDLSGLSKATLVLTIDPGQHVNGWGNGRTVSVQALNAAWHEGNGKSFGYKKKDAVSGTGSGATWFSPVDENIGNDSTNSVVNWDGGATSAYPPTAPAAQLSNHQSGTVEFDVTADLLNGAQHGWLIKQDNENVGAKVSFYSREGAVAAGNQDLAPRLVLEFGAPVASAPSGSLLSRLGFGSVGNRLQPTNSTELRSVKQLLQQSPATAYAAEQLLSVATRQHPLLNITTRIAYRSWLNEEPTLAALPLRLSQSQSQSVLPLV